MQKKKDAIYEDRVTVKCKRIASVILFSQVEISMLLANSEYWTKLHVLWKSEDIKFKDAIFSLHCYCVFSVFETSLALWLTSRRYSCQYLLKINHFLKWLTSKTARNFTTPSKYTVPINKRMGVGAVFFLSICKRKIQYLYWCCKFCTQHNILLGNFNV